MRVVVTAFLMLVTTSAWAAEWVKVGEADNITYYIDSTPIRKNADLRRVWVLQDRKVRTSNGELSVRGLEEFDCRGTRVRLLSISSHSEQMATGKVLFNASDTGGWNSMTPGTVMETIFKDVCS